MGMQMAVLRSTVAGKWCSVSKPFCESSPNPLHVNKDNIWNAGTVIWRRCGLEKEEANKTRRDLMEEEKFHLMSSSGEDCAAIFNLLLKIRPSALVAYLELQRRVARTWLAELIMSWGWAEILHCVYVKTQMLFCFPPTLMHRIALSCKQAN